MERQVAIFCSASSTIDAKYNAAARELVRALHSKGYSIISGGGAIGTMGAIAEESYRLGCLHIGVLPSFMLGLESNLSNEVVWTADMASRKARMRRDCCAAVALPGGIGTLDELIEVFVLKKLGKYDGAIYALDLDGFFQPLRQLLGHMVKHGMLLEKDMELVEFPSTVEELANKFQ